MQATLGVFLRESQPGFNGSDFQGALTFEDYYGSCTYDGNLAGPDVLDQMVDDAIAQDATVSELIAALKDRLMGHGIVTRDEEALIVDLLGSTFATPMSEVNDDFSERLRLLCGALLLSPEYFLVLDTEPTGSSPALARSSDADCAVLTDLMANTGIVVDCEDGLPL